MSLQLYIIDVNISVSIAVCTLCLQCHETRQIFYLLGTLIQLLQQQWQHKNLQHILQNKYTLKLVMQEYCSAKAIHYNGIIDTSLYRFQRIAVLIIQEYTPPFSKASIHQHNKYEQYNIYWLLFNHKDIKRSNGEVYPCYTEACRSS